MKISTKIIITIVCIFIGLIITFFFYYNNGETIISEERKNSPIEIDGIILGEDESMDISHLMENSFGGSPNGRMIQYGNGERVYVIDGERETFSEISEYTYENSGYYVQDESGQQAYIIEGKDAEFLE